MPMTCHAFFSVLKKLQSATPLAADGGEGRDRWTPYSGDKKCSWTHVRHTEII